MFIRPTVLRNDAQATAEAKRRSEMLKASEELELDKKFPRELPADKKPAKQVAPVPEPEPKLEPKPEPKKAESTAAPKSAVTNSTDRQSAKIKALKMQETDGATP